MSRIFSFPKVERAFGPTAGGFIGSRGTLLVTGEGEAAARESGLGYKVVDLAKSKLDQGWN